MTPELMASARVVLEIEKLAELSEKQRANVDKAVEKLKVDEDEAKLRGVVGRPPVVTVPQLARRAGMGALLSVAAGSATDLIKNAPKTVAEAMAHPYNMDRRMAELQATFGSRNVASRAIGGAVFGLGIPYAQYLLDREAAKQGWY
jgi:hypothetical protein